MMLAPLFYNRWWITEAIPSYTRRSWHDKRSGHHAMRRSQSDHVLLSVAHPEVQPNCLSLQASFRLPGERR
jgi:hypothetical protein